MRKIDAVALCFLLFGLAALGDWGEVGALPTAGAAQGDEADQVDDRASRLRKRLGPFCRNFDFFYRHSFARGLMRPVRCSRRERTVVLVYAFSDRDTRDGWLNEWGGVAKERGAPVIRRGRWAVEVLVRKHAKEIRRRLTD